jgi:hypothetical protein
LAELNSFKAYTATHKAFCNSLVVGSVFNNKTITRYGTNSNDKNIYFDDDSFLSFSDFYLACEQSLSTKGIPILTTKYSV